MKNNNCNNSCYNTSYNFKINMIVLLVFLLILGVAFYFYLNLVIENKQKESNKIHNLVNNLSRSANNKNQEVMVFTNEMVKNKYESLVDVLGKETYLEKKGNEFSSAVWMSPLDEFNQKGKFGGCDYVRINGYVARKYHPVPAHVFVLVGKYLYVPDNLIGALKYASETINIDHLQVPKPINDHYEETGEKLASLVTGSCGSITISAVTVKFVEDMINKYKNIDIANPLDLFDEFRKEYDNRIQNYLCGGGIKPEIDWYSPEYFNEPEVFKGNIPGCDKYNKNNNLNKNNKNNKNKNNNLNNLKQVFDVNNNSNVSLSPSDSISHILAPSLSNVEKFHGRRHRRRGPVSHAPG